MDNFNFYGTVSRATMRNQDLIPCFLEVLEKLDPNGYAGYLDGLEDAGYPIAYIESLEDHDEFWYSSAAWEICYELFDLLEQLAPDGYYFGAHVGDGSDYGFWAIEDEY